MCIIDMPESVLSTIKLFADDSLHVLYRKVTNERDCALFQQDLHRLKEWEKWQMAFNSDKCQVLCITNKKCPFQQDYFIHSQKLAIKSEAKYLGVTIICDLSWSKHVTHISRKANFTMAFLRHNIRPAYKTFVTPVLEYASTVLVPHTETDTNQLETVQRRAVRFVQSDNRCTSSVTVMCEDLGWDTLNNTETRHIYP